MFLNLIKHKFLSVMVILTVIICLLAGVHSFVFVRMEKANIFTDALGIVVSPVQGAFTWVFDNIASVPRYFTTLTKLQAENDELKKTVLELENAAAEKDAYKIENERLRDMLDLKQWNREYELVGAEVIARGVNTWYDTIKIDKGTSDGLAKNDVVVSNSGLVGYISDIGTTWATVLTIISPQSNVSCVIPRTGEIVMAKGSVAQSVNGKCKIEFLPAQCSVAEGEAVETSGEGGIFPKGLLVGRIGNIEDEQNGMSKKAEITPVADFKGLREVLVIKMSGERE